jgi:RNA polymerase sigma factor (TIGR02999 family)
MQVSDSATFTSLFQQWRQGNAEAGERLFQMIYVDLLRLAQSYVSHERSAQIIDAPSLVNRAYLRLFDEEKIEVECRAHFFVIAARQMRRILIDLSRRRKRSPEIARPALDELEEAAEDKLQAQPFQIDVLALDEALTELEEISERACRAVELRFFAGLTEVKAAEASGVSLATFKRDWTFAKRWLYARLQ